MDNSLAFADWLISEMAGRNWSQSDLARAASVTPTAISDVINGRRDPGSSLCRGIAEALNMPPKIVFIKAGLLPPEHEINEQIELIMYEAAQLTEDEQEELIAYMRMKRNLRERK